MTPRRAKIEPHVSLAIYDRLDPAAMTAALQPFAAGRRACPVRLASLGLFPAPSSVLFAAPIVSAELLALHRAFHQATWAFAASCWAHYLPENWVPHLTLGEGLTPGVVQAVIVDAIMAWRPKAGILHSLSLVRFHPVEVLWSTNLGPADR